MDDKEIKGSDFMWLKVFGAVIVLVGLILVFDARRIIKKNFPTANENEAVLGAKIFGVLIVVVGGFLCL